jgi:peroxiredoxin
LPTTYIIDRQGRIRDKMIGERTREAFEAVIKPLLDEAQTTAQK